MFQRHMDFLEPILKLNNTKSTMSRNGQESEEGNEHVTSTDLNDTIEPQSKKVISFHFQANT